MATLVQQGTPADIEALSHLDELMPPAVGADHAGRNVKELSSMQKLGIALAVIGTVGGIIALCVFCPPVGAAVVGVLSAIAAAAAASPVWATALICAGLGALAITGIVLYASSSCEKKADEAQQLPHDDVDDVTSGDEGAVVANRAAGRDGDHEVVGD